VKRVLIVGMLLMVSLGCASVRKRWDNATEDMKALAIENIPEAERILGSTSKDEGTDRTGVEVIKWGKGQKKGYVAIEIWDLMPPVENNKIGPEYYLMVARGSKIRRGDTMTMARRGKRDEIRHYFTCADPAYGKKRCNSVGSTYPDAWTLLEWEWEPGSMDFRVNGKSAKNSPVEKFAGEIRDMWIPGCANATRVYPCKWRHLVVKTDDEPESGADGVWTELE